MRALVSCYKIAHAQIIDIDLGMYDTSYLNNMIRRSERHKICVPRCIAKNCHKIGEYLLSKNVSEKASILKVSVPSIFSKDWNRFASFYVKEISESDNFAIQTIKKHGFVIVPDGHYRHHYTEFACGEDRIFFTICGDDANRANTDLLFFTNSDKDLSQTELVKDLKEYTRKCRNEKITAPKIEIPTSSVDCIGQTVFVGTWVAYSDMNYADQNIGVIESFTPKAMNVRKKGTNSTTLKRSSQIVRLCDSVAIVLTLES
jgi:hypothetical protein